MTVDVAFIKVFIEALEQKNIAYAILRNADEIMSGDAHDIDMTLDFGQFEEVMALLKELCTERWKIHSVVEKDVYNLCAVHLYTIDDSVPILLHLDFFKSFSWNGYPLLDYHMMLRNRVRCDWLYEAAPSIQGVTMLFSRLLHHGYIKAKYRDRIREVFLADEDNIMLLMQAFLPKKIAKAILEDVQAGDWQNIEQEYPVVRRSIEARFRRTQWILPLKKIWFNIYRLSKKAGIILSVNSEIQQQELDVRKCLQELQKLLSRTFTEDDVEIIGGGYFLLSFRRIIQERIALSRGKLIFLTDRRADRDTIFIEDAHAADAHKLAIEVLDKMAKRYRE